MDHDGGAQNIASTTKVKYIAQEVFSVTALYRNTVAARKNSRGILILRRVCMEYGRIL